MEYKIGLIGCGKLGQIIAQGLAGGKIPACSLVAVMGSGMDRASALAEKTGCTACRDIDEMLAYKPDYIIEAATAEALKENAEKVLRGDCSLITLSNGAYSDEAFTARLADIARANGTHVHMAPGVTGGFDLACAASLCGELDAVLTKYKYPRDSGRCPAGLMELPDDYEGSVREAFAMSPRHLNIGIAAGLVCGSLDKTRLCVKPADLAGDMGYELSLSGEFGEATIYVRQGGKNCKLSGPALAAWSALAVLKRVTDPITY